MHREFLGIHEIAQLCDVSSAAVGNWRNRHSDFPKPIANLKSGPVFDGNSVKQWLIRNSKYHSEYNLSKRNGVKMIKTVAVIGRSRSGKSHICSKLSSDENILKEALTDEGKDCTKVNFRFHIQQNLSENMRRIQFEGPGSTLNGTQAPLDSSEEIKNFIKKIELENTYSNKEPHLQGEKRELNSQTDTFDIYTTPSELALRIMGDEIETLIVTDTPGVSGDVNGLNNLPTADLFILAMRSDNELEYDTMIEKISPIVAGSNVLFVYRISSTFSNESQYEKATLRTKDSILKFEDSISKLRKNSIIENSFELLNPSFSVITMGAFNIDEPSFAEDKFDTDFSKALYNLLRDHPYKREENTLKELLPNIKNEKNVFNFTKNLLNNFNSGLPIGDSNLNDFKKFGHDRVKTKDDYIVEHAVISTKRALLESLFKYFQNIDIDESLELPTEVQTALIIYIYKKLTFAIKFDCGISNGNHPFEANPPLTMWAEEAILANILNKIQDLDASKYKSVLQQNGISSATWGYVTINPTKYTGEYSFANKKLEVISETGLLNLRSLNTTELVNNSYTLGLFKLGEYSIYKFILSMFNLEQNPIMYINKI